MIIDAPYANGILIGTVSWNLNQIETIYSSTNTSNRMNIMRNKNKNNEILYNIHRKCFCDLIILILTLELKEIDYNGTMEGIKFILCLIDGLLYQNGMSIPNGIYYSCIYFGSLCEENKLYNYYLSKWMNYFGNNNKQIEHCVEERPQWINNEMIVLCLQYYGLINMKNNKQLKDAIIKYLREENIFYYLYMIEELDGILIDFLCQSNKYLRQLVLGSISNESIGVSTTSNRSNINWCIAYNLMIIDLQYTNTILIKTMYSSTDTSNRMN